MPPKVTGGAAAAADKEAYFLPQSRVSMSDVHKRYCRCVPHVAAQQSEACLRKLHGGYRPPRGDKTCYQPYAVCTASTRRTGPGTSECLVHYDLAALPAREARALSLLKTGAPNGAALRRAQREAAAKTTLTVAELRAEAKRLGVPLSVGGQRKTKDVLERDVRRAKRPKPLPRVPAAALAKRRYIDAWGQDMTRARLEELSKAAGLPRSKAGAKLTKQQLRRQLARVAYERRTEQ